MALPLEGIRVIDLSRLLPGPHCSLMLADFGADVIKVEKPIEGDPSRWKDPKLGEHSIMYVALNRNKRSIALDLKRQEDREIFIDLVKSSDVLIESFRPGVMARLGLSYEDVKRYNPRLIYCSITGYGQKGPFAQKPGHDLNFSAYSGLLYFQEGHMNEPLIPSVQIGDLGSGALMAFNGILLALMEASKSGEGQHIDLSMLDSYIYKMQTILPHYFANRMHPDREKLRFDDERACYETYKTKDGRYLAVGAFEYKFWTNFCKVIEKEELIPKLHAPLEEQKKMKAEIQSILRKKTLQQWLLLFNEDETCVSPVLTPEEIVENEHIQHRQMIEDRQLPDGTLIKQISNPIKMSRSKTMNRRPAPQLGEHTDEILEELGYVHSKEDS
ncbi:MAG TPA: CaiB/BaiF CoA-transferase family protein [Chondromyces sp.]|nr:CaiB/BaiF CoA-transferase family protein [Chondromyces sp.]